MVRHYFPQSANSAVHTNTNYPPQSAQENSSPPPVEGRMAYENFVTMEYEDFEDMDYEG